MLSYLQTQAKTTTKPAFTPVWSGHLQRCTAMTECDDCRNKRLALRRNPMNQAESSSVPPIVHDVLRSPGQPLDEGIRASLEPRFGHDFSRVRIHTDAMAAESARAVNALSYTVGQDIVFASGQYAPRTMKGDRLLAHELTHVIQQSISVGRPQFSKGVSEPGEPAEIEADAIAKRVANGFSAKPIVSPVATIQRKDGEEESDEPAEKPMTRSEEVALSRTSAGEITGTAKPLVITIFNFAIDNSTLKPEHKAVLAEVADLIKKSDPSKVGVFVIGHADSSGSPKVNRPLSQRRAKAVQESLERLSGRSVTAEWAGDTRPADTNDTVKGRNRNRRVDIHFLPIGGVTPPPKKEEPPPVKEPPPPKKEPPPESKELPPIKEPPPTKEPPKKEDDDKAFCIEHPLICAAIIGGGAAILFCIMNPAACLPKVPVFPPPPPGGPGEPEKDKDKDKKKKEERPCLVNVDLPSGTIKAKLLGQFLIAGFNMGITFEDDPTRGCFCRLGEYRQMVRGFAERDDGTGVMRPADPPGLKLDRTTYQEDLRGGVVPYGLRSAPIGNTDADQFLPDRETGCEYKGSDSPGMQNVKPGEHCRFRFEFRGGPVDARMRSVEIGSWNGWVVEADITRPKPPPPKKEPPESKEPPPKKEPPSVTPPVPEYKGPSIGPAPETGEPPPDFCLGGTIGCKTLEFLQDQVRDHTFLTQADVNKAVDIEFEILKKNRIAPIVVDPHQAEEYWKWIAGLRLEARNRIHEFAKTHFMPFPE